MTLKAPHWLAVLGIWAGATALTWMLARLAAADTPATPWAPASPTWSQHVSFWDAGWYERIWREGYPTTLPLDSQGQVAQNAWAFMPGLPLVAGAVVTVASWFGVPASPTTFYACAAVVSLCASAAAALLTDRWLAPQVGESRSLAAVAVAWSMPCALVMQTGYAEALGLALVTGALLCTERGRPVAAAGLILAACLTRPVGAALAAALALAAVLRWWRPGLAGRLRASPRTLACLAGVAVAATAAWPVIAWLATGRVDAYPATETAWRGQGLATLMPVWGRAATWVGPHLAVVAVVTAATAAGVALLSLRHRVGLLAWCWCVAYVAYLAAVFDPTSSLLRLLIPLAPAVWVLPAGRRRTLALVAAGVLGQVWWMSWVWDLGSVSVSWVP